MREAGHAATRRLRNAVLAAVPLLFTALPAGAQQAHQATSATPAARDVAAVLEDLRALKSGAGGPAGGRESVKARRAALARELFDLQPSHPQLVTLMPQRWDTMLQDAQLRAVAESEMEAIVSAQPSPELVAQAWYWRVQAAVAGNDHVAIESAVSAFREHYPLDPKGARMLELLAAGAASHEPERALAWYREVLEDYPGFPGAIFVPGKVRQIEQVGKPFELAFDDVVTGQRVDVAALRGQLVVLHFWSARSPACRDDLAALSALRDQFAPRGVAFLGIIVGASREDAALGELREKLKAWQVSWPQGLAGDEAGQPFDVAWGVDEPPADFVLDRDGRLAECQTLGRLARVLVERLETDRRLEPPDPH